MSAQPIPAPPSDAKPIRSVCKTPLSYFTVLLKEFESPAARACFGLILNETTKPGASTWAHIKPEQFAAVAVTVDRSYVMDQVDRVENAGFTRHQDPGGKYKNREYSINPLLAKEMRGEKIKGRCAECKQVGQFSTEFVAMPRTFFTHLPQRCDNATYLVVALVARYSHDHAWTGDGGLVPKWQEINFQELSRDSGLSKESIAAGVKKATAGDRPLIERDPRPGRASWYRTLPENWEQAAVKTPRLVIQPTRKNPKPKENTETPANPQKPPQSSPVFIRHGFCGSCNHIVVVEDVSEAELRSERAETGVEPISRPARAGPHRSRTVVDEPLSSFKQFKKGVW